MGALAPWLLTLLRVVQGLPAGGELGGAVSMTTEFAPPGRRGLYGSRQSFTVALGLLGGAGVPATVFSEPQLDYWDWRLPFLLILPLGHGALWLRLRLHGTRTRLRPVPSVFSGCAGLIITETVKRTGSVDIPGYYAEAACAVSAPALATPRTRKGR
ncbi:MFS transporter [Streptomyces sp. NPDC091879]|uniref:MFS transporter n=1 Tax=Streptomyces sp. NPDC091879 TaxID=3366006 RepID=UPI00382B3A12